MRVLGQVWIGPDDDQIVSIAASGEKTARIIKGAELKVCKGGSHGLAQVDPETFKTCSPSCARERYMRTG
jgi:pimeloyl-ACP methyl ester carboxylesterase